MGYILYPNRFDIYHALFAKQGRISDVCVNNYLWDRCAKFIGITLTFVTGRAKLIIGGDLTLYFYYTPFS